MTREEEMKIAIFKEHQRNQAIEEATRFLDIQERSGFKVGVEWADEHPRDNLVNIYKACDIIKHLLGGYIIRNFHSGDSYDMDKIIDDFIKAVEGE